MSLSCIVQTLWDLSSYIIEESVSLFVNKNGCKLEQKHILLKNEKRCMAAYCLKKERKQGRC